MTNNSSASISSLHKKYFLRSAFSGWAGEDKSHHHVAEKNGNEAMSKRPADKSAGC